MSGLRARGLESVINDLVARGVPLLGICVGMQALFDVGEEMGEHAGLGLLPGRVLRFAENLSVKIPHTGWNQLMVRKDALLFDQVDDGAYVYFNHSYYCQPRKSSDVVATTDYGLQYACAVQRDNIFGVQFHPEKSQTVGLQILEKFFGGNMSFTIYPAIDLRGGKVVRLKEGDPARMTAYSDDPAETARRWLAMGAEWLHVVNLDGAFGEGDGANQQALLSILKIANEFDADVQFGGGLRSLDSMSQALSLGVSRIVLGTVAVENSDVVTKALKKFGVKKIAVGIDARDGVVRVRGWQSDGGVSAQDLALQMRMLGLRTIIFTDVSRDGMGHGLNIPATRELADVSGMDVIASGGVHTLEDVTAARDAGLSGAIVGSALYEGTIDLGKALQV